MSGSEAGFGACHELHTAAVVVTTRADPQNETHLASMNLTAQPTDGRRFVV